MECSVGEEVKREEGVGGKSPDAEADVEQDDEGDDVDDDVVELLVDWDFPGVPGEADPVGDVQRTDSGKVQQRKQRQTRRVGEADQGIDNNQRILRRHIELVRHNHRIRCLLQYLPEPFFDQTSPDIIHNHTLQQVHPRQHNSHQKQVNIIGWNEHVPIGDEVRDDLHVREIDKIEDSEVSIRGVPEDTGVQDKREETGVDKGGDDNDDEVGFVLFGPGFGFHETDDEFDDDSEDDVAESGGNGGDDEQSVVDENGSVDGSASGDYGCVWR